MILKWVQSVLLGPRPSETKVDSAHKKLEPADIVHEALRADADELSDLVNLGQPALSRKKLKENIKRKVKKSLMPAWDDDDVAEEVTERILDAAEFDPHYKEMFDEEEKTV